MTIAKTLQTLFPSNVLLFNYLSNGSKEIKASGVCSKYFHYLFKDDSSLSIPKVKKVGIINQLHSTVVDPTIF